MKGLSTLALASFLSVFGSFVAQAEPFLFIYDPVITIVSLDDQFVSLRLEKSSKAPIILMSHQCLSFLNFAVASARSLDDILVVDLNHAKTHQDPHFFVGIRKDSLDDGWLIDARFVTSVALEKDKIAYFFDRRDKKAVIKLDEHPLGEKSPFAKAIDEHVNGFIRVSGSLRRSTFQAEFIGFDSFAVFHTDELSSFGTVCGRGTNDSAVKLMLLDKDTKWLKVLQTARRAVCIHQGFAEMERRLVTHFRLVGTEFSFPQEL